MSKRTVSNDYKKIVKWLEENGKSSFKLKDVTENTGIRYNTVEVFVHRRLKLKMFERIRIPGEKEVLFKMLVSKIPLQIPKGHLSDAVFHILKEHSRQYPEGYIRLNVILIKVIKIIPQATMDSTNAIIQRWFNGGFLIREFIKNKYEYRLANENLMERPVTKA